MRDPLTVAISAMFRAILPAAPTTPAAPAAPTSNPPTKNRSGADTLTGAIGQSRNVR